MLSISRFPVLIGVLLVLVISEVSAGMFGFGRKYDVQLFPPVQGRILLDGSALPGVTVIREATYDEAEIQETRTNHEGYFSFPAWTIKSRTPGKPLVEDRLRQVIIVNHQGSKYVLWYYVTGRIDGEKVVAEKLQTLNCDLQNEEIDHHFQKVENPDFTHNISSICRW